MFNPASPALYASAPTPCHNRCQAIQGDCRAMVRHSPLKPALFKAALVIFMATLLSACPQSGEQAADNAASADSDSSSETIQGDIMSDNPQVSLDEAVELARQDLAERAAVNDSDITTVEARQVTWANGAVGCPEQGMMYPQALVDGYFILLRAADQDWPYHAGRTGRPFHCPIERSRGSKRYERGAIKQDPSASGVRQPQVAAQGAVGVVRPEQAAPLQLRHNMINKRLNAVRQHGRH